jgi:hypothetical protein
MNPKAQAVEKTIKNAARKSPEPNQTPSPGFLAGWKSLQKIILFVDSLILYSRSRRGFLVLFTFLRGIVVVVLMVNFLFFQQIKDPWQLISYLIYGLIIFLVNLLPFFGNRSFSQQDTDHYPIIFIDVVFISIFIYLNKTIGTEIYLFYLIPLITAAHFLKRGWAVFSTVCILVTYIFILAVVQAQLGNAISANFLWVAVSRALFLAASAWLYRIQRSLPTPEESQIISPKDARFHLEALLDELKQSVEYDSASLQILYRNKLQIVACRGFSNPLQIYRIEFPIDDPNYPNQKVITERHWVIADSKDYPSFQNQSYQLTKMRSWLGIPLISPATGELFGMLTLDSNKPGAFYPKEAKVATWFASKAATYVLDSAMGPSALTISTKREAFHVMNKFWVKHLPNKIEWKSDNQAADDIVKLCDKIFFVEDSSLFFTRNRYPYESGEQTSVLHLVASTAIPKADFIRHEIQVSDQKGVGLTGYAVAKGITINYGLQEVEASPYHGNYTGHLRHLKSQRCKQILIAPIKNSQGKEIGALKIENKIGWSSLKRFPLEEQYLFEAFARLVGLMIEEVRQRNYIDRQRSTIHNLRALISGNVIRPMNALASEALQVDKHSPDLRWRVENIQKAVVFAAMSMDRFLLDPAEDMVLENDGLIPALRSYIYNLAGGFPNFGKACERIQFEPTLTRDNLPFAVRVAFYNIGREALMNIIRHSKIDEKEGGCAKILFERKGEIAQLVIEDNGAGFSIEEKQGPAYFGIEEMRNELKKIQGDERETGITIDAAPGRGTCIAVRWKPTYGWIA